jgi:hypothetical protein
MTRTVGGGKFFVPRLFVPLAYVKEAFLMSVKIEN